MYILAEISAYHLQLYGSHFFWAPLHRARVLPYSLIARIYCNAWFLQQNVFNTIKTTSIYLNRAFKFQHKCISMSSISIITE